MKFRVYTGAALSLLDLFTDIETIIRFTRQGKTPHFAFLNILFICVSLCFQLCLVYVQNQKRETKVMAYEMLIVLCMLKPAIGKL